MSLAIHECYLLARVVRVATGRSAKIGAKVNSVGRQWIDCHCTLTTAHGTEC